MEDNKDWVEFNNQGLAEHLGMNGKDSDKLAKQVNLSWQKRHFHTPYNLLALGNFQPPTYSDFIIVDDRCIIFH